MVTPVSYLQTDSRWASNKYATTGETSTIKSAGCGIVCSAMVIATLADPKVTPADTAKWSMSHGYKAYKQGTYYSYFKPQLAAYNISCEQVNGATVYHGANSAKTVNANVTQSVRNGNWIICAMGAGDWTSSGHFVLWYGIDSDGNALIRDPNSTKAARVKAPVSKLQYQAKFYFEVKVGSPSAVTPSTSLAEQILANGAKFVIDVSSHNGTVDWTKVKVDGVIIRAGYRGYGQGTLTTDTQFSANVQGCVKNSLAYSVYWFTTAITEKEAVEEAEYVLGLVKGLKLWYPIFIDTEYSNSSQSGRSDSLSKSVRTKIIKAFCDRIQKDGYVAGIYASESWFKDMLDVTQLPYRKWVANYSRRPTYVNYDGWQRTANGTVNGVKGNMDVSEWYSERVIYDPTKGQSYEEPYYPTGVTPAPEPKPEPPVEQAPVYKPGEWSLEAREWATSTGLVQGDGSGIVWGDNVTLERFVTILHRLAVKDQTVKIDNGAIVPDAKIDNGNQWSAEARTWAVANGIVLGDGTGIDWSKNVTMEQAVTIMYRASKK